VYSKWNGENDPIGERRLLLKAQEARDTGRRTSLATVTEDKAKRDGVSVLRSGSLSGRRIQIGGAQMVRSHEPGEAAFKSILPEDIHWNPFPAFPASARLAVLVGDPTQAGPYLIRVKLPSGVKLMPHKHPEDRIYTVMSGVFYIGLGETFDGEKLQAYPPGSVIVLPGETWHFHWAKSGEYVTQVSAIGPLGLEYLNPGDDPRQQNRR
jgi:quercetin dioxygenase-like cupin family protein